MTVKKRLDILLAEGGYAPSREKARSLVMSGVVFVNGQREDKPGTAFDPEKIDIEVRGDTLPYVSRGGLKLEKALRVFPIEPAGKVCLDIGASTGGFTDCMLQNGAAAVFAVDVGYGQLDWKLRSDPRVVCLEKTNFRYLKKETLLAAAAGRALPSAAPAEESAREEPAAETADPPAAGRGDGGPQSGSGSDWTPTFAACDVSFISLSKILPAAADILPAGSQMVCLIKPQFEAGRDKVGKKGVVRDPKVHRAVTRQSLGYAAESGFAVRGLDYSPIRGPEGNIEYLMYLERLPAGVLPGRGARDAGAAGEKADLPEVPAGADGWNDARIADLVARSHAAFGEQSGQKMN